MTVRDWGAVAGCPWLGFVGQVIVWNTGTGSVEGAAILLFGAT